MKNLCQPSEVFRCESAKGLELSQIVESTNIIAETIKALIKYTTEDTMPNVWKFKARALTQFMIIYEIMALVEPELIQISLFSAAETFDYKRYICPCGVISKSEIKF